MVQLAIRQGAGRLALRVWRPGVEEAGFANSPAAFARLHHLVLIDACRLSSGYAVEGKVRPQSSSHVYPTHRRCIWQGLSWHFTIRAADGNVSHLSSGEECARSWQAPSEGLYALHVTVFQALASSCPMPSVEDWPWC